jgi:hypothetical protein
MTDFQGVRRLRMRRKKGRNDSMSGKEATSSAGEIARF